MNFQKFQRIKMPEVLQNPPKIHRAAKMLSLLQEWFSLSGFGRSETVYKCWNNVWLRNSSRLFQGFCVTKLSKEMQVPHGAPKISIPVAQKGEAQQCWPLPCLGFHTLSAIHEAKLGTQKQQKRAQPTYITHCVGGICSRLRRSSDNTSRWAPRCILVHQSHDKAVWQYEILQRSGIITYITKYMLHAMTRADCTSQAETKDQPRTPACCCTEMESRPFPLPWSQEPHALGSQVESEQKPNLSPPPVRAESLKMRNGDLKAH